MSVGAILSRTANYFFRKLNFDYPYWATYEHQNWDEVDAAIHALGASIGIKGAWTNSTAVLAGERYVDTTTGNPYVVLISHTTAASPTTFAADRLANPTYWAADSISDNTITLAKIQDISSPTLLGRFTSGNGDPEVVSTLIARQNLGILPHGQCVLNYVSTSVIRLDPKNGNRLMIGDVPCKVPSAGVTLAPTGLTANTDYYIFAQDSNADEIVDTLIAELTSVGISVDATTGVTIKTGDRTKTLVGIARPVAGPAWEYNSKRFVRSYFNRQRVATSTISSTNRTFTTVGTPVLINAALRAEIVAFTDDGLTGQISYPVFNGGANESYIAIAVDGTLGTTDYGVNTGTAVVTVTKTLPFNVATDGYHYIDVFGAVSAGTGTVGKSASGLSGRTSVIVG